MRRHSVGVVAVVVAGALAVTTLATRSAEAWESYTQAIPNGRNVEVDGEKWTGVGHTSPWGGGPTNSFGRDFARAGYKWTKELCEKDSDNDGRTNGQELGDPDCTWKVGGKPKFSCATHPGLKTDDEEFCVGDTRPALPMDDAVPAPAPKVMRDL